MQPTIQDNYCPRCGVKKFDVIKMEGRIRNQSFSSQYGKFESFTDTTFDGCQCKVCGEEWSFFGNQLNIAGTPIEPDQDWMTIFGSIVSGLDGNIPEKTHTLFDKTDILWAKLQVRKHNVAIHKEVLIKRNSVPNPPPKETP